MKILSLFDWMSCWQLAITNLWITDYTYYSSEIDKWAIQVTQENFPNTIQIWDVTKIRWENYKDITLLAWWSPCQWFSFAWKQLNFEDERSKLFFEYVRILKEVKPKYFLLENVRMKKEYQDVISEYLFWIQPTIINSSLLTAQNRLRLYRVWELQEDWTYKQVEIEQPEDRWILLKDILEDEVDEKFYFEDRLWKQITWKNSLNKIRVSIRLPNEKGKCLTAWGQAIANAWATNIKLWNRLRKLTPIECERLQWVRDWYTAWVSNSQRYKMLGNWWTVPVIEHILKHLNLNK